MEEIQLPSPNKGGVTKSTTKLLIDKLNCNIGVRERLCREPLYIQALNRLGIKKHSDYSVIFVIFLNSPSFAA